MEALSAEWKRSTRAGRALPWCSWTSTASNSSTISTAISRATWFSSASGRFWKPIAGAPTCGRYGGDEFVILMPETNMEHAGKDGANSGIGALRGVTAAGAGFVFLGRRRRVSGADAPQDDGFRESMLGLYPLDVTATGARRKEGDIVVAT